MIPVIIEHQLVRNDENSINEVKTELPSVPQIGSYIHYLKDENQLVMKIDLIEYVIDNNNYFTHVIISNLE